MPSVSQTAPGQAPSFEVASVREIQNDSRPKSQDDIMLGCHGTDNHSLGITVPMGRCVARYEPLRLVIALAYDVPPAHMGTYEGKILSGPDWINSAMYSIDAKADAPTTDAQLKLMLQSLLADRFKLKLHREKRDLPIYALVTTKNGLKFQAAPKDRECGEQVRRDHRYELGATSLAGQCHAFVPENGALTGHSVDMSDFAEMLSIWAGRMVVDKTGIPGLFDLKMPRMTSANVETSQLAVDKAREGGPGRPIEGARIPVDSVLTVFAAVEQFGLKLESARGPVEVLVIDDIQKPTEN
jgi:uncharacterized protein (TIGR03435 family)